MGGKGSGGKNASHKRAEDYIRLEIKDYVTNTIPSYMLDLSRDLPIFEPLEITESKKFFICPKCKKNVRTLYIVDDVAQCRKCGNLNYESQQSRTKLTKRAEAKELLLEMEKLMGNPLEKVVKKKRFKVKRHSELSEPRNDHADFLSFIRQLDRMAQGKKWKTVNADIIDIMKTPEAKADCARAIEEVDNAPSSAQLLKSNCPEDDSGLDLDELWLALQNPETPEAKADCAGVIEETGDVLSDLLCIANNPEADLALEFKKFMSRF